MKIKYGIIAVAVSGASGCSTVDLQRGKVGGRPKERCKSHRQSNIVTRRNPQKDMSK